MIGTHTHPAGTGRRTRRLLLAAAGALALGTAAPASANTPEWQPQASERLVKLPATYLEQAVKQDFEGSALAGALADVEQKIQARQKSLKEIRTALKKASDQKMRTELQHQLLVKKRGFVKLLGKRAELRRRQIKTRVDLYNRLLDQVRNDEPATAAAKQLRKNQQKAVERFKDVVGKVDMEMFGSVAAKQSEYNKEYTENRQAMERLVQAIKDHPLSAKATVDGKTVTKKQYLQRLVSKSEAQLALLDQKETMYGYMAKLVALDAMALSTGLGKGKNGDGAGPGSDPKVTAANAVDTFLAK